MATEIAQAYVQLIPSARGITGKIQSILDPEASAAGQSAGQSLGSSLVGVMTKVIAAAGIGKAFSAAISEGAALQQSLGGVETLFKGSADKVKGYANEAYKTTGLSANAYMENVTGFSASLLQSLGGDTNKAAETANMAMIDMSDNANKMGTSMESIQMAYQGFAKQNYTMLDNLKLGYGGTKQEMQRLLADAEKLTGVKYDINNLSDVYNAIHAIQENLDITGTTAKEAASTFSGSFESMKAAAQNVLGKIAIGENVTPALQSLLETTKTFLFGNFLPMVGNILSGLGVVLTHGLSDIASQLFGDAFGSAVFDQVSHVTGIFETFFDMIFGSMDKEANFEILDALGFSEDAANQIINIADNIRVTFENIGSAIGDVLSIIGDFVGDLLGIKDGEQGVNLLGFAFEALTGFLREATGIIKEITSFFKENQLAADLLKSAVVALGIGFPVAKIATFVQGLGGLPGIFTIVQTAISGFATSAMAAISSIPLVGWIAAAVAALAWFFTQTETGKAILQDFMSWLSETWSAIAPILTEVWNGMVEAATTAWNAMVEFVSPIIQSVVDFIKSVWDGISVWWSENQGLIQQTFETVWNAIQMVIQTVMPIIQSIIETAMNILAPFIETTWNNICTVVTTVWELIKIAIQTAMDVISGIITAVLAVINGDWETAWNAIKSVGESTWNGLSSAGQAIFDGFSQILSNIWETIKSVASSAWEALKASVLSIIDGLVSGAQSAWDTMSNAVSTLVSNVTEFFDQLWNINLFSAGQAILQGFLDGLQSVWSSVTDFVGGIAGWIADHKGPIEYDRKLLIPAGNAIMKGLDQGLQDQFKDVKQTVGGMAEEISDVFSGDGLDLNSSASVTKSLEAQLAMPSAQFEAHESKTVSEIAILRASMERILTAILEKSSDVYLDNDIISLKTYEQHGAIYARGGI
ncbi:PblA [Streptococcus sp. SO4]|uniref:phage tail protein n=1 Tax=Streptococcus sp. SO4 TaxID=3018249 RepID=UPI00263CCC19|nr:PblA [Streptococcus sp. SO4]MDN5025119.1 PblA [Streptococcus sp. SO4]